MQYDSFIHICLLRTDNITLKLLSLSNQSIKFQVLKFENILLVISKVMLRYTNGNLP
jgi:hypothetical protein